MNYRDFRNFKMIIIAEYMQKIITDLPQRLNNFWKVSDKTHQGRAWSEPNQAHADKSQRRSLSLCDRQVFKLPTELQSPPGCTGFVCTTVAHHSQWKGHQKSVGSPAWGSRGCTPALGSSHTAFIAQWLCSAIPRALVQSYQVEEVPMTAKL